MWEVWVEISFNLPSRSELATQLIEGYQSFAASCLIAVPLSEYIQRLITAISFSFESNFFDQPVSAKKASRA